MMMRRLVGRTPVLSRFLGLRGGYLLRMGLLYVAFTVPAVWTRTPPGSTQAYLERWIPHVGWTWAAAGLVAMGFAFARSPRFDAFGFAALVSVPVIWSSASLAAAVEWDAPRLYYSAFLYVTLASPSWWIAGWREPSMVGEHGG